MITQLKQAMEHRKKKNCNFYQTQKGAILQTCTQRIENTIFMVKKDSYLNIFGNFNSSLFAFLEKN